VSRQIIHDDDVAGCQRRDQAALDIGAEDRAGHRPVNDKGCRHRVDPQAGDKGGGFPMTVRHPSDQPGTASAAAVSAGHVGGRAGLVDKHQPTRIKLRLEALPHLSCRRHVGALLLGGVYGFFKADAVPVEKPPHRAHGNPHTALVQKHADLFHGEIGTLADQRQQPLRVRLQWRAAAALFVISPRRSRCVASGQPRRSLSTRRCPTGAPPRAPKPHPQPPGSRGSADRSNTPSPCRLPTASMGAFCLKPPDLEILQS
jgi:hypothetical protein